MLENAQSFGWLQIFIHYQVSLSTYMLAQRQDDWESVVLAALISKKVVGISAFNKFLIFAVVRIIYILKMFSGVLKYMFSVYVEC